MDAVFNIYCGLFNCLTFTASNSCSFHFHSIFTISKYRSMYYITNNITAWKLKCDKIIWNIELSSTNEYKKPSYKMTKVHDAICVFIIQLCS